MARPIIESNSNWRHKSEKNIVASSLLLKNELANQSVHCSYYSCVQYIFHVMNVQFGMETEEVERESKFSGTGTHRWLRNIIYQSVKSKNDKNAYIFYKNMYEMYHARNRADYKHEVILINEAEKLRNKAITMVKFLKQHYEL